MVRRSQLLLAMTLFLAGACTSGREVGDSSELTPSVPANTLAQEPACKRLAQGGNTAFLIEGRRLPRRLDAIVGAAETAHDVRLRDAAERIRHGEMDAINDLVKRCNFLTSLQQASSRQGIARTP